MITRLLASVAVFALLFVIISWRYAGGYHDGHVQGVHDAVQGLADAGRICGIPPVEQ